MTLHNGVLTYVENSDKPVGLTLRARREITTLFEIRWAMMW
jgi:hypothetical protein